MINKNETQACSNPDNNKIILNENQKIGTCELCKKKDVIVQASGYYVAFVCLECLK